jgi:hypothetical protein
MSDQDIPEEMAVKAIAAGTRDAEIHAMALRGAGLFYALPKIVNVVLSAALAGRTQTCDRCGGPVGYVVCGDCEKQLEAGRGDQHV